MYPGGLSGVSRLKSELKRWPLVLSVTKTLRRQRGQRKHSTSNKALYASPKNQVFYDCNWTVNHRRTRQTETFQQQSHSPRKQTLTTQEQSKIQIQIQKEVISDLKCENLFLSKEICESIWLISREREICEPVLKLDFTAHGIMESFSEFGLWLPILYLYYQSKSITQETKKVNWWFK
jgi:hypothetical protein